MNLADNQVPEPAKAKDKQRNCEVQIMPAASAIYGVNAEHSELKT